MSDTERLKSLLSLVLYFYWDAVLFGGNGRIAITTSNDEVVFIYAKQPGDLDEVRSLLALLNIPLQEQTQAARMRSMVLNDGIEEMDDDALEELRLALRTLPKLRALRVQVAKAVYSSFVLACERKGQYSESLIDELRDLAGRHPHDSQILLELVKSLFYAIAWQSANARTERLGAFAEELVRIAADSQQNSDVIRWVKALEW